MFIGQLNRLKVMSAMARLLVTLGKKKKRLRGSRFWANTGQTGHVGVGVARLAHPPDGTCGLLSNGPTHQPPFALPPRCPNPGPNCVPHCSKSPRDQNLLTPFQKGKKICLSKLPNEENYLSICLILQLRSANLGLRAVA